MATGFERNNITHDRLPVAAARLKTARTIFFFLHTFKWRQRPLK